MHLNNLNAPVLNVLRQKLKYIFYEGLFRTSQRKKSDFLLQRKHWSGLYRETIAVDYKEYVEHTNNLCGLSVESLVRNLFLCILYLSFRAS